MSNERTVSIKSADRVLDLLELLSAKGRALSHTEIAHALGIPKSSLSQLLRNVAGKGYIVLAPGSNGYELGPSFFALARRARLGADFVSLSRPILERLTAATQESSSFNLFSGGYLERVCGVDSPQVLTYRMTPGTRFLLYSSSAGKAVLAALPEDERGRFLASVHLVPRTEATVKTVAELRRQLAKVAREGVAYSRGEHMLGVMSIAVVVRRRDGYPLGAINVAIPRIRFTPTLRALCVRELKAAAVALEQDLPEKLI